MVAASSSRVCNPARPRFRLHDAAVSERVANSCRSAARPNPNQFAGYRLHRLRGCEERHVHSGTDFEWARFQQWVVVSIVGREGSGLSFLRDAGRRSDKADLRSSPHRRCRDDRSFVGQVTGFHAKAQRKDAKARVLFASWRPTLRLCVKLSYDSDAAGVITGFCDRRERKNDVRSRTFS